MDYTNNKDEKIGPLTNAVSDDKSITINRLNNVTTVTTRDRNTGKVTTETFIGDSPYRKCVHHRNAACPFHRTTLVEGKGWFPSMRWLVAVLAGTLFAVSAVTAQDSPRPDPERKIMHKVVPVYPDLARRMQLSGAVKLVVVVAPNGSVKSSEPAGGSPVFIMAAEDAVKEWKFVPASEETRQTIEFHFSPR
jgi:protein TonB